MTRADPAALLGIETRLELARRSTSWAVRLVEPGFRPLPWQRDLAAVCDRWADAAMERRIINGTLSTAPRHGKTLHVGLGLPLGVCIRAARAGEPMPVLYGTASDDLAKRVSRKMRGAISSIYRLTEDPAFAPHPDGPWEATEFRTRGDFWWSAKGVGSTTGGIPARLLIMDDLIGSGAVYRSKAKRAAVRDAVEDDFLSRLEGGPAIQMETRRGIHDTTGYIMEHYGDAWEHHVWRCYDPSREGSPYLWPDRFGAEWRRLNPHLHDSSPTWRSLYQQEPVPEGGTYILPEWLAHTYHESPEVAHVASGRVVIGVDLAATGKTSSDHCAFVVLKARGAFRDVLDVVRVQAGYVEQKRLLRELAARWKPDAIVVEQAAGGHQIVEELQSEIPAVRGESPGTRDKVTRLSPWLEVMAAGQLRLPAAPQPWTRGLRAELEAFAGIDGEPDDQVDALVWALVAAAGPRRVIKPGEMLEALEASDW